MRYFLNLFPTWRLEELALLKLYFVSDFNNTICHFIEHLLYVRHHIHAYPIQSYTNYADFQYVAEKKTESNKGRRRILGLSGFKTYVFSP